MSLVWLESEVSDSSTYPSVRTVFQTNKTISKTFKRDLFIAIIIIFNIWCLFRVVECQEPINAVLLWGQRSDKRGWNRSHVVEVAWFREAMKHGNAEHRQPVFAQRTLLGNWFSNYGMFVCVGEAADKGAALKIPRDTKVGLVLEPGCIISTSLSLSVLSLLFLAFTLIPSPPSLSSISTLPVLPFPIHHSLSSRPIRHPLSSTSFISAQRKKNTCPPNSATSRSTWIYTQRAPLSVLFVSWFLLSLFWVRVVESISST